MNEQHYEEPELRVLGAVTDVTQMSKPGIFFDFPFSAQGNDHPPFHKKHHHHIS